MAWARALGYGLLVLLAAFAAVWIDLGLLIWVFDVGMGPFRPEDHYGSPTDAMKLGGRVAATAAILGIGGVLMAWGFRSGWDWTVARARIAGTRWSRPSLLAVAGGLPEFAALVGASMWVLIGYVDEAPLWWEVLPPFLLPWLLLLVELEPRHRLVLLAIQWLSSSMLLEIWTGGVATTALFGLALVHIAAVWASLPDGPLRRVPLGVAIALALVTVGTATWFLVNGPTLRRAILVAALLVVTGIAAWLARNRRVQAARLPVLVGRPGA